MLAAESNAALNTWAQWKWPEETLVDDVTLVDEAMARELLERAPEARMVLIVAGFPCKDTSRLKHNRRNLSGRQSGLFVHIPRVRDIFRKSECSYRG